MKRLLPAAASAAIAFGLMAGTAGAQAAGCSLVNTGPDSNNTCEIVNENSLEISCKNDIDVVFVNNQSSGSGSVTLEENTNGGYAFSGNAVNTNDATGNLDVRCAAAQEEVTPPPAPAPGGKGGPVQPAAAKPVVKAAVLPVTGTEALATTVVVATVLGAIAGAAGLGAKAYKLFRS